MVGTYNTTSLRNFGACYCTYVPYSYLILYGTFEEIQLQDLAVIAFTSVRSSFSSPRISFGQDFGTVDRVLLQCLLVVARKAAAVVCKYSTPVLSSLVRANGSQPQRGISRSRVRS